MERIDAFTHYLPGSVHRTLVEEHGFGELSGSLSFLRDVERRLEDMDDFGVDRQVVTLALPTVWRGMDPGTALPLTRQANDGVRGLADEHPERFVPVGTIPFPGEGYAGELERCVDELGMPGVQVFSNVDGRPLDDPAFDPLWAAAERTGATLWLHPQHHPWYDWIDEYMDHRLFGWPFDTTLALSRLVFGGVLERYDLDLVAHHLGGMVPFYGARVEMFYETRLAYPENYDAEFPAFSRPPVERFREFYADTAVDGSAPALACGRAFFGDDHVLFGTDYPFGPDRGRAKLRATVEAIEEAELPAGTRANIYAENVRKLL